ncbi:MAG: LAGLIDADG family homing endonuclease [Caldisericum sp.]
MANMKPEEIAYIAGFFDGEGSIYTSKGKKQYFLTVSITNTNLYVLEFIRELLHIGKISKNPDKNLGHRKVYRLRLYSNDAKNFLEILLPYLKVKAEQAKIAIEFQNKMKNGKLTIPKEEQEYYRNLISSFNLKKKKQSW